MHAENNVLFFRFNFFIFFLKYHLLKVYETVLTKTRFLTSSAFDKVFDIIFSFILFFQKNARRKEILTHRTIRHDL